MNANHTDVLLVVPAYVAKGVYFTGCRSSRGASVLLGSLRTRIFLRRAGCYAYVLVFYAELGRTRWEHVGLLSADVILMSSIALSKNPGVERLFFLRIREWNHSIII